MMVEQLLRFVLANMYCQKDGTTYQQTSGVAMGTACAPPVANIYMAADFETSARQQADVWPRFYFRLIDDGFFIWEYGLPALSLFQQLLGSLRPNIRLVFQQHTQCIPYLDVYIAKDMSATGDMVPIMFSTYQKPHNKYLKQRLLARGYPNSFLQPIFDTITHADRQYYLQQQQHHRQQRQQQQQQDATGGGGCE